MPKLIIMKDQTGATGKDIHDIEVGLCPLDALMRHFPDGINEDYAQVFIGIKEVSIFDDAMLTPTNSNITVVLEAKGLDPITIAIGISLLSAAISYALTPDIPGAAGVVKQSPNNNLSAQTNVARAYQAYPLIFGSPRVYPDLTGDALVEYVDNVKNISQLVCVGMNTYDLGDVRLGDTLTDSFTGSSNTFYQPVNKETIVPNVTYAKLIEEVGGQQLEGVGDEQAEYSLEESGTELTTFVGDVYTFLIVEDADSLALKTDFDASTGDFFLKVNYRRGLRFGGFADAVGTGEVESITLDVLGFYEVILTGFNGETSTFDVYSYANPFVSVNVSATFVGPISISRSAEEVWFNFSFVRGLRSTVDIRITMQQLDGLNGDPVVGPQQAFIFSFTEDDLHQQFKTFKGVLFSAGFYTFTIAREDNESKDANFPDDTRLDSVYAINKDTNVNFGNLTLIDSVITATVGSTTSNDNKINLDVISRLISYDGVNVDYTLTASRRCADALLHMYVDFYGLDPATLDLNELYDIQDKLDAIDPRLATFDFTFDDIDVSLDERMDAILQVMRVTKWLDGDVYRFVRDEERAFESTVISRNDITAHEDREFSMMFNPSLLQSFDSVKIEYVDPVTNKKAYIYRSLDGGGSIVNVVGQNPKTMELAGCREQFNAINRAELEIRKLMYQRWTLSDTLLPSAMLLDKGDLVLYAEQYNNSNNVFDGEITAINGNIATTSESIDFDGVSDYVINYTLDDGSKVGPFVITEVTDEPFKFQCDSLAQAYLRDSTLGFLIQCGSRYIINTVDNLNESRWTVTEKEMQGDNVQISMVNYDSRIYDFDGV